MRHRLSRRQLGRTATHRKALIHNQVTDLLRHDRIVTTEAKAKEVRPVAEKVIALGKRGDTNARRQAGAVLNDQAVVHRLFSELGPRFQDRPGGYTRITKLGPRLGDGARMAQLELVEGAVTDTILAPAPTTPDVAAPDQDPAPDQDTAPDTDATPADPPTDNAPADHADGEITTDESQDTKEDA
ncbi:MAG: large subunit ribosomal protein L17 [Chloroflexi bacterium]|nr:MAG: large subunit ribosomal protein L17 [Chloroflexota bacterium]